MSPRNATAASAISGRTSGPRPAMNANTAVSGAGRPNRYSRCPARAQRCMPNHITPIQQITRPVSRPEVAKSRAGGSITYTSTPNGNRSIGAPAGARRVPRYMTRVPSIANTTASMLRVSATPSTTSSSRPPVTSWVP